MVLCSAFVCIWGRRRRLQASLCVTEQQSIRLKTCHLHGNNYSHIHLILKLIPSYTNLREKSSYTVSISEAKMFLDRIKIHNI